MDSLANYDSDGENSNNSIDVKMPNTEKCNTHDRRAIDVNYDPVQMDMSEDSNNNNSSGDSGSDATRSPAASHQSSTTSKSDSRRTRTPPADQRRSDHESNTSNCRGESKGMEKNDRTRTSDDKCRRSLTDSKRQRDSNSKDTKRSRDDERKSRDDERRRDRTSSSSSRDDRKEDRDKKEKDHHHHRHRDDIHERRRDRDRRHSRIDRTKERHREEQRSSSHQKEKDRVRSRSRSKERAPLPFRTMSYREEKSRNKLAQLEKLGIELKAPEGTAVTPIMLGEQNYYNPSTTASQGKYAEQIQKRKLLWANKSKQEDSKVTATVVESTANTWVGTTFTHDQDGKLTAKFKRLMGIKEGAPAAPSAGQKPEILKKQEEMFSNMEQQYEVARATTHTQRGVGLGYASSGYQFPR